MVKIRHLCSDCFQEIKMPICESCHLKRFSSWLSEYGVDPSVNFYLIKSIKSNTLLETSLICRSCKSESVSLCTYCFFLKVDEALRNLDLPEEMISYFIEIFNNRLYTATYWHDPITS